MGIDLLFIVAVVIWIIVGTSYLRWHPFFVLLISALGLAFLLQIPIAQIPETISTGFGNMFKNIGLLILFGAWIGIALEATNATTSIAKGIIKKLTLLPLPFVISALGYLVSIPVFCDAAFVILAPLTKKLSANNTVRRNALTVALSTGLFSAHVLVPPTPGPLAAAGNLQLANLSLLLLAGGIFGIVLMLIGAFYAYYFFRKSNLNDTFDTGNLIEHFNEEKNLPSFSEAIWPLALPILLMATASIIPLFLTEGPFFTDLILFVGDPVIALLLGMLAAFYNCKKRKKDMGEIIKKGIQQAAPILLITAMGGALGAVIQSANLTEGLRLDSFNNSLGLTIPFLLAALLKSAQGSSTVAIITISSIMLPLLPALGLDSEMGKVWVILAIGAGSLTVSHANDSYFWIVSQMGEMSVKEAYRKHTIGTLLQGVIGICVLLAVYSIFNAL
ncbi:GntP family permease [Leeuwenhoekiella marinoflava]|uniref:Predicted D-glycerate permease n=2 Tax=Leeuwenhoekiella marinoflava TaxID=988 RepID=A0ABY1HYB7_9FLAO|nr:GntP family permease [Leeuwenhoekiella marinoflava]RXG24169.1 putative D-glycerate permease [Leeuwenhoekiella marinoflava]SHF93083.1 predicted D-glycerate permease [Leeuwenhoekiella marinoflava DSM 3653]